MKKISLETPLLLLNPTTSPIPFPFSSLISVRVRRLDKADLAIQHSFQLASAMVYAVIQEALRDMSALHHLCISFSSHLGLIVKQFLWVSVKGVSEGYRAHAPTSMYYRTICICVLNDLLYRPSRSGRELRFSYSTSIFS